MSGRAIRRIGAFALVGLGLLAEPVSAQTQLRVIQRQVQASLYQIVQGTLTSDQQAISTTATWNNAGVTFKHWRAVITDTNSAAGSLPIEILGGAAGATSLLTLSKAGVLTTNDSVIAANYLASGANSTLQSGATGRIRWQSSTVLQAPSDGTIVLLNNAETDFSRLGLGGTTSAFTAIERAGNAIRLRTGDGTVATFASLTACSAAMEGALAPVSDADTAVWGATITGGSSTNHVLAYCDGTNWTVAAK